MRLFTRIARASRPTSTGSVPDCAFSALSFFFNFSQNVLKGTVVDALLWGSPWIVSLEDLLTGLPADDPRRPAKEKLARILMSYARANPIRSAAGPPPPSSTTLRPDDGRSTRCAECSTRQCHRGDPPPPGRLRRMGTAPGI